MTTKNDLLTLRERELFQHFGEDEFEQLGQVLSFGGHADGEIIHRANKAVAQGGRALLIILDGEIKVSTEVDEKSQVAVSRSMKAGELMGLISFMNGGAHTATSQARGAVKVAALRRDSYDNLRSSNPSLAAAIQYMIAKQLARDLRMCDRRLSNALHKGINWDDLPSFVRR